jgi:NAD(P) transhydrogenase subunit alpha
MFRLSIISLLGLVLTVPLSQAQTLEPDAVTSSAAVPSNSVLAPGPGEAPSAAVEPAPTPATPAAEPAPVPTHPETATAHEEFIDYTSLLYVFMLATFIGLGVILRVSRLLHTPLMSLTNAISAIAVVGSILVTGDPNHPIGIRILGAIALFASMTNIVSGFLITDRMLKMFKQPGQGGQR